MQHGVREDRVEDDREGLLDDDVEDHRDAGEEDARPERGEFFGTCKTTLIDWIQLVQMGRRDALLAVHSYDGKQGTLWCRDGDIIDADCDGLAGEAAVFRALSWKGGRVSVDFDVAVTRRRQVQTATAGLLLKAAYRRDSGIHELSELTGASTPDGEALAPFDLGIDNTEVSAPLVLPAQQPGGNRISLGFAIAGGLTVVLLFLAIAWRWLAPAPAPAPASIADKPAAVRVIPGRPSSAQRPVASSSDEGVRGLVRSTFTATEVPPLRKAAGATPPGASKVAPARRHPTVALVRRSATTGISSLSPRLSEVPRAAAPAKLKVDIIQEPPEPPPPRVQIIRETGARAQPRIQIIEDRKPRIERVE